MTISEQDWENVFRRDSRSGTDNNRIRVNYKPYTPKLSTEEIWFNRIGGLITVGICLIIFWVVAYGVYLLFNWGAG